MKYPPSASERLIAVPCLFAQVVEPILRRDTRRALPNFRYGAVGEEAHMDELGWTRQT